MPFAGDWWFRERLEELIEWREIGMELLMAAATAGAAAQGRGRKSAFLVFSYGAADLQTGPLPAGTERAHASWNSAMASS